jgi:hypothetical protein
MDMLTAKILRFPLERLARQYPDHAGVQALALVGTFPFTVLGLTLPFVAMAFASWSLIGPFGILFAVAAITAFCISYAEEGVTPSRRQVIFCFGAMCPSLVALGSVATLPFWGLHLLLEATRLGPTLSDLLASQSVLIRWGLGAAASQLLFAALMRFGAPIAFVIPSICYESRSALGAFRRSKEIHSDLDAIEQSHIRSIADVWILTALTTTLSLTFHSFPVNLLGSLLLPIAPAIAAAASFSAYAKHLELPAIPVVQSKQASHTEKLAPVPEQPLSHDTQEAA